MKVKLTQEMRKKMWLYVFVVAVGISIYFAFAKFDSIVNIYKQVVSLMTPFIIGFAFAFLLNKPMMFIEEKLFGGLDWKSSTKRNVSAVIALIFGLIVVTVVIGMLVPQLFDSIMTLLNALPDYIEHTEEIVLDFFTTNGINSDIITSFAEKNDLIGKATNIVTNLIPQVVDYTYQIGSAILDLLLGIVSALYMLMDKDRLLRYCKKINYALFPINVSSYLHRLALSSCDIFNNFIIGKAIDSIIIGILCYIGTVVFKFPYGILVSVFIGVTNMIPVFGPFIGGIPGTLIMFMIDPWLALWFALFVFALQQFDGNFLGPLILGDKLGIPTIGILFSVCIGGGLFGVAGMFIGVPCFAVIYQAIREYINIRLEKKELSLDELSAQANNNKYKKEPVSE
ncbi:MAG: AI-2E family transporter [Longicatena sp.]|nr:AI-2E family transporter [Longicatena sp.]